MRRNLWVVTVTLATKTFNWKTGNNNFLIMKLRNMTDNNIYSEGSNHRNPTSDKLLYRNIAQMPTYFPAKNKASKTQPTN